MNTVVIDGRQYDVAARGPCSITLLCGELDAKHVRAVVGSSFRHRCEGTLIGSIIRIETTPDGQLIEIGLHYDL